MKKRDIAYSTHIFITWSIILHIKNDGLMIPPQSLNIKYRVDSAFIKCIKKVKHQQT